jgi:hypothetical protein
MHRSKRRTRLPILFDHVIGAGEQRDRRIEAERLPKVL